MNSNKKFLISVAVFAALIFAGAAFFMNSKPSSSEFEPLRVSSEILIAPHSLIKGPTDAKVTVVEFLDPECEACRAIYPSVNRILTEYQGRIRFVIRYMPFHGSSEYAIAALEEARELGKFDEALATLFENQPEWGSHHHPKPELIPEYLKRIGMNSKQLDRNYLLEKHRAKIMKDLDDGKKAGVTGTPTFFVNGRTLYQLGYETLKGLIDEELAKAK